ncbi:COR domain-containing protein [Marinifilum fragile]|uniref:COR domain-containing protein n=1 Tax=Marinifilum fragile TaxID=570161 RepID=UPI002AA62C1D|nr:COR domain-containing protein [Marinifilum fragile]
MDDLKVIRKLEQKVNVKLPRLKFISMPQKGYTVENNSINGVALCSSNIADLNQIVGLLMELKNLSILYLSRNVISDLDPLYKLINLTKLDLRENRISDISPLRNHLKLDKLYLKNNFIVDISPLKNLKRLERLDLRFNKIEALPVWITEFNLMEPILGKGKKGYMLVDNNPIQSPPPEIIKQGRVAIKAWFKAKRKKLNEVKVVLVGDAKAGKTSILKRLQANSYNENENQTNGISIEKFDFKKLDTFKNNKELHEIKASFWDFGGQEILFSTHQFFLSRRSVYILVLEARKDIDPEKQVQSWLNRIKTYAGNSPVIVVVNKIDLNPAFSIDEYSIREEFNKIQEIVSVSCKTNENIEKLKQILEKIIPKSELFETEIDERWLILKEDIQKLTDEKSFITHFDFRELCIKRGVKKQVEQRNVINFLHDLGIVLHFDDLKLSEYYVLDPFWVTNGVYKILTSNVSARQKGEIESDQLFSLVNENQSLESSIEYSPNETRYIADIMVLFKLAFYSNNRQKLLIPDLLEKTHNTSVYQKIKSSSEKISLIYSYDYLLSSVIPRLIVELRKDIKTLWRKGFIIESDVNFKATALVYSAGNKINIFVLGEPKQKREYLSVIRFFLDAINEDLDLNPKIYIPLPDTSNKYVKLDILQKMEKAGELKYKDWDIEKEFNISLLLEGIEDNENINKMFTHSNINDVYRNNPFQLLERIIDKTDTILKKQDEILIQVSSSLDLLMKLPENSSNKREIEDVIEYLLKQQSEDIISEIISFIIKALTELDLEIKDKINEVISLISDTDNWDTKVKLSVPLLNLVGINIEHEYSLKKHIKKIIG